MRRSLIRLCLIAIALISYNIDYAQQAKKKVACVGDSITEGWKLGGTEQTYPYILQQLLGPDFEVKNFGHSGKTLLKLKLESTDSYWRSDKFQKAKEYQPDIVIIKLGTNDSKPDYWDEFKNQFYGDYVELIQSFKALDSKPKIYVCIPIRVFSTNFSITENVLRREVIPLIKKAAQHMKCDIINLYAAFYDKDEFILDGVHPIAEGNQFIAEEVYKALTK